MIRGATSSFGQAALKMAVDAAVTVIATTRSTKRFPMLEKLGAKRCEIERRDLSQHIPEAKKINAVLDLVGNTVMLDSLAMLPGAVAALALPAFWVAWLLSQTLIRCNRWRVASI